MAHVSSLVAKNGLSLSHRNAPSSLKCVFDIQSCIYSNYHQCSIMTQCMCVGIPIHSPLSAVGVDNLSLVTLDRENLNNRAEGLKHMR